MPVCQTLSKALDRSLKMMLILDWGLDLYFDIDSVRYARAVWVDRFFRKPCWRGLWRLRYVRDWPVLLLRMRSYIFPSVFRREIGR